MLLVSSHDIPDIGLYCYKTELQNEREIHLPTAAVVSRLTVIVLVATGIIFLQNIKLSRPVRRVSDLFALI